MPPSEIIDKIETLIDKDIEATHVAERSSKSLENPNWAFKQAYVNGYLKALYNIKKFIDLYKRQEKEQRVDRLTTTDNGTSDRPYEVIS